jgi:hypothetical protein
MLLLFWNGLLETGPAVPGVTYYVFIDDPGSISYQNTPAESSGIAYTDRTNSRTIEYRHLPPSRDL